MSTSRALPRPTGRPHTGVRPVYENFKPTSEWKEDDEHSNILLLINLPGFQTRDLKVSTEGRNIIRVRGERLVAGNKWSRFQEDFPVPNDCIMIGIRAIFDGGILTITIPRKKKQPQDATPSTVIPSQTTSENPTSKSQPNPIREQIKQQTPKKRVEDPSVLDDNKVAKDNSKLLEENKPTLDHPFQFREPTPLKRVNDEQKALDDHEKETKDYQKLLEGKRPTLEPFQIRKPTPLKRANDEQRVLDDHEKETKDNHKLLEEKRPTLDPFQIRKQNPLKRANDEQRVLDDHEKETKDYQKLLEEKRPTLDPFQIKKPTPMKWSNDEQRVLDDPDRETKDYKNMQEEKRPTLDPFQIKKPNPFLRANEQRVLDDHVHKVDGTKHENNKDIDKSMIIHKEKDPGEFLDKSKQIEASKKISKAATSSVSDDQTAGINYKKKVRSFLDVNEERQLLVNMGVAVLVLVALGIQISHTIGSREAAS